MLITIFFPSKFILSLVCFVLFLFLIFSSFCFVLKGTFMVCISWIYNMKLQWWPDRNPSNSKWNWCLDQYLHTKGVWYGLSKQYSETSGNRVHIFSPLFCVTNMIWECKCHVVVGGYIEKEYKYIKYILLFLWVEGCVG